MLIDDLYHARGSVAESRAYAENLLWTLLQGLATDPYKECSQAYRTLVEQFEVGHEDEIIATIESLKSHSVVPLAHTARLVDDITKASWAVSNVEAAAWLQVAAARALEYAWCGHVWETDTERQLEGRLPHLGRRLMDLLAGRHSAIDAKQTKLWQFYWWLRLSIARGNGEIPAIEGIRIVCQSKRSDVENALGAIT